MSSWRDHAPPSVSRNQVARAEVTMIAQQVQLYLLNNGFVRLPNGFTLDVLTHGRTPYLLPLDLVDPWGGTYAVARTAGGGFRVRSHAADRAVGGSGDATDIVSAARVPFSSAPRPSE
jgi:hypothetical protein